MGVSCAVGVLASPFVGRRCDSHRGYGAPTRCSTRMILLLPTSHPPSSPFQVFKCVEHRECDFRVREVPVPPSDTA